MLRSLQKLYHPLWWHLAHFSSGDLHGFDSRTPALTHEWSAYYQIKLDREAALSPVVVTKNGRAVAVLLNVTDDDDLERILLANSPKLWKILDAAEQRIQATGGISHADIWNTIEAVEEA